MSGFEIEAQGHARWLPLPVEGDVEQQSRTTVSAVLGGLVPPDRLDEVTALVAGMTRLVRKQAVAAAHEGVPTFLAWMLLPGPGMVQGGPIALLRGQPLSADATTDDDVVRALVDVDGPRFGELDVDHLDTASGRALLVHLRPVVELDGERVVHEQRLALWPDRARGWVLVLSFYVTDLLEGAGAEQPFAELAAGLRWQVG